MTDPRTPADGETASRRSTIASASASATSRSLLQRIRTGDPSAWDRLVELYGPLVLAWCRRFGISREDGADVFQEVFTAVARNIADFRKQSPGDTFRGWLRTVTRNKITDHFRRASGQAVGEGGTTAMVRIAQVPEPAEGSVESTADPSERGLFLRALEMIRAEFENRTWQAFWQTTVEARSAPEVAAELGMSAGAVRVAKSRVLRRLREELGDAAE
jgi:RNA polymerase sigma-70 factor (ECF subfamily)